MRNEQGTASCKRLGEGEAPAMKVHVARARRGTSAVLAEARSDETPGLKIPLVNDLFMVRTAWMGNCMETAWD